MLSLSSIFFALIAGLVSFLSPCVLPLVPGYLAFLGGTTLSRAGQNRASIFVSSIFFVLGFSVVFATIGLLLNTTLERIAYDVQLWLGRIGGAVIIFFGLYLLGLIHISWLEAEHKLHIKKFSSRHLTAFIFGAAFAAGWTPCVGAVLGGILALAASFPGSAFALLLTYSLGLGIPFLLVGLFADRAQHLITRLGPALHVINKIFGVLLIGLGILVFTNTLPLIANFDFVNRCLQRV